MTCEQVAEQLDTYVLGGLGADKEVEIAHHISTCAHCQQALEQARKTADVLALVTAPPRSSTAWRRRIRSAIDPTPKTTRRRDSRQTMRLPGTLDLSPGALLLVMILLIAVGAIWGTIQFRNRMSGTPTAGELKQQLEDRDTLVSLVVDQSVAEYAIAATSKDVAAVARFYADPKSRQGGLVAWNLPGLPAGQTYQVWLVDAVGAYTSGGTFQVGQDSAGSILVRSRLPLGSYRSLEVTIEPAGGSRNPSGPRVLKGTF